MGRLDGKAAIITGASRGIELTMVRVFVLDGASAAIFLAGDDSHDVVGQTINVDAGQVML
jgi:NAD(P)-dependent dehydrogenase (short-subunit alcohol dehydrogenase family)